MLVFNLVLNCRYLKEWIVLYTQCYTRFFWQVSSRERLLKNNKELGITASKQELPSFLRTSTFFWSCWSYRINSASASAKTLSSHIIKQNSILCMTAEQSLTNDSFLNRYFKYPLFCHPNSTKKEECPRWMVRHKITLFPHTSKSWYCSSVSDFLATTSVRSPSRAMLPHWMGQTTGELRTQSTAWTCSILCANRAICTTTFGISLDS